MDRMKEMSMLEERAWEDIKQLLKKENITPVEWDNISKVVCTLKELKVMESMDVYVDEEYGYSNNSMPIRYRHDGTGMPRRGYSGHSVHDRMIAKLEKMMDETDSDYERKQIADEISRMRMSSRAN